MAKSTQPWKPDATKDTQIAALHAALPISNAAHRATTAEQAFAMLRGTSGFEAANSADEHDGLMYMRFNWYRIRLP